MEVEEKELERNINNITCDTSFESPVTMNVQKKDANWSLERRLAAAFLEEMVQEFKGCTIQSDKKVGKIIDSEEHVDARNRLKTIPPNRLMQQVIPKNWLWMEAIQKAIHV